MSAERQVMQDYLDALVKRADFTRYFTEDVIATFEGTDQPAASASRMRSGPPGSPAAPPGCGPADDAHHARRAGLPA